MTITTFQPVGKHFKITQDEIQDGNQVHFKDEYDVLLGYRGVEKGPGVPGFRKLIANGLNASTALEAEDWIYEETSANLRFGIQLKTGSPTFGFRDVYVKGGFVQPDFALNLVIDGDELKRAENLALTRFYAELASVESVFKGQVFSGELREALHAIRHPAQALRKGVSVYLTALKKGQRIPFSRRPRFVRDTWLEYSFGWRPLIADIDNAITSFYNSDLVKPIFQMVKASGKYENRGDVSSRLQNMGYGFWTSWINAHVLTTQVKYYGIYRSTGSGVSNGHSYGFSPWEFVPTLWELIPYSFLVDYFTNIGNIISSWSYRFLGADWAAKGTKFEHSCTTGAVRTFYNPDYYDPSLYNHWLSGDPGSSTLRHRKLFREPSVYLALPSLECHVPGMDSLKWINIAALSKNLASARRSLQPSGRGLGDRLTSSGEFRGSTN